MTTTTEDRSAYMFAAHQPWCVPGECDEDEPGSETSDGKLAWSHAGSHPETMTDAKGRTLMTIWGASEIQDAGWESPDLYLDVPGGAITLTAAQCQELGNRLLEAASAMAAIQAGAAQR